MASELLPFSAPIENAIGSLQSYIDEKYIAQELSEEIYARLFVLSHAIRNHEIVHKYEADILSPQVDYTDHKSITISVAKVRKSTYVAVGSELDICHPGTFCTINDHDVSLYSIIDKMKRADNEQYIVVDDNDKNITYVRALQNYIDEEKQALGDGIYLELCNRLQKLHDRSLYRVPVEIQRPLPIFDSDEGLSVSVSREINYVYVSRSKQKDRHPNVEAFNSIHTIDRRPITFKATGRRILIERVFEDQ